MTNRDNFINYAKNHKGSALLRIFVWVSALLTISILLFLVGFIAVKGIRHITPDLFALHYNSDNVSLMPALINTLIITALSLLVAVPLGIFSAI